MRFIPSILRSFPFNVMLYFVGFLSPPLPAAAASYDRIQTLSMDEGLPHSDVNAITQDRDGYLWFATFSGLSKYDGYRLQTFRTDNSDLTSDRILCLFVARDSSLYIGTESGGLNRYDPVSETIFPVAEEPTTSADQVINNIFEDRKGTVWVFRNDGLGYLTLRGATTYLHVKNRWRGFYIQCGTALDSCRLLLSTDAGPVIYNPETEEIQNILRDEIKTRCFSMQSFADGKIALSGGWGVRIYHPTSHPGSRRRTITETSGSEVSTGDCTNTTGMVLRLFTTTPNSPFLMPSTPLRSAHCSRIVPGCFGSERSAAA